MRADSRTVSGRALFAALVLFGGVVQVNASDSRPYPSRSINLIVPWAPGGGSDRVGRFLADALQRRLGQPVIVINRTGGGGAVGHSAGALAAPDGHTLTLATFELSTMRAMRISPLTWENFTPVAQVNADAAALIVRQDAPWRTLGELLEAIRREPGRLKMSGTATGGAWDLGRAGLLLAAGLPATNVIWAPAQGSAPALVELLGGHIDVVCCSVPEAVAQLEGGPLRVLAVLSPQRLALFPEYPTAREQGIDYAAAAWRGLMLPKGASPSVVRKLNETLTEITRSPEFAGFMKKNGFAVEVRDAGEFTRFLIEQEVKWKEVIKKAGYESLGSTSDPGPRALPIALGVMLLVFLGLEAALSRRRAVAVAVGVAEPELLVGPPGDDSSSSEGDASAFQARDRLDPMEPRLFVSTATHGRAAAARQPGPEAAESAPATSRNGLLLVGALIVYVTVMPWVGFPASTGGFAFVMMWRLGTRWWHAALGAGAIVGAIHLLFVTLFKVPLP